MDEPQVSSQVEETDASSEKSDFNAVLASTFVEEIEKPMDVDTSVSEAEPSTSADVAIPQPSTEAYDVFAVPAPVDNDEDAGQSLDESMSVSLDEEVSESVEHIIMEKPESELDETIQSTVEGDTLDFTEASINISQLNVEHNDDSNDAFNALKESEIDVLETPKEEIEEPKEIEEEPEEDAVPTPTDALEETVEPSVDAEDSVPTPAPMDTDDIDEDKETEPNAELNEETCHELGVATDTADLDADLDAGGIGETSEVADKPDAEETEDITEDDGTTETTNEGEGVDENVCLLGDENDVAETEKDAASLNEETPEEEDQEATTIDADAADDVIEGDEAGKETEEPEEPEEVEPMEVELIAEVLKENEIREISGELTEESCLNCENSAKCPYKVLEESGDIKFLCSFNCVKEHREDNPDKYTVSQKQVVIQEILPAENVCSKCAETKSCKYRYKVKVSTTVTKDPPALAEGEEPPEEPPQPTVETVQSIEEKYLCEDECQKAFVGDNSEKYLVKEIRKRAARVREPPKRLEAVEEQEVPKIVARSDAEVEAAKLDRDQSFIRRCGQCFDVINFNSKALQWETSDFCNEKCLGSYQNLIGAACSHCNQAVTLSSIGKLCVRFGPDIHQFCTTQCLNDFKKCHQPCSYCSKNLKNSSDEYIGRKRGNFCDDDCARRYEEVVNPKKKLPPYLCSVCNIKKSPKVEVLLDGNIHRFCSNPCFSAFKFVNNVAPDQCDLCSKYFERKLDESHTIFQANAPKIFCTRICMSIFISKARVIQQCNWCKVSKYNFDMVLLPGDKQMCSLNCLSLHEVSVAAVSRKRSKCDHCHQQKQPQYHLTMSDASIRSFCTYQCVMAFQNQITKSRAAGDIPDVVPAGTAKRIKPASTPSQPSKAPVISIVHSGLGSRRSGRQPYNPIMNRRTGSPIPVPELTVQLERLSDLPPRVKVSSLSSLTGGGSSSWTPISHSRGSSPVRVEHKTQVVTIPPLPKQVGNKSTMCKSITLNKAISCVPSTAEAECQTEDWLEQRIILPVPIILFVPQPMMMYNMPTPIAVPIPLPIPVPVFVPTTRNSAQGIMKEIKKIQDKMPTDPYEAELLMMAEMVAGDKKREETDSNSDENNEIEYGDGIEQNSSFNEDLVQIAFKMAGNDFDDPSVDLENEMTASTISQSSNAYDVMDPHSSQHHQLLLLQQQREAEAMQSNRGRKRMQPQPKIQQQTNNRNSAPNKRIKREMEVMQSEIPREPTEKPDANMCLKYTFGVNAWKQWVATKNADFEKSSIRRKPIKSEILQLTADELNYSLCMFVKEVRKPNSSEYAPDTIYYLVLGIQQYLYENGRIDNIFTDRYYEQFTDCLDEVAKKFSVLYNDSQYIVTRVEEEHLWECKQLGAHSPHVLLSTLMFFNTKHFNLVTVDEHMELSFSHIMKHWKRNPNQPGAAKLPGSRNVLLRFYPPQSSLEANSRKKKVYEQQENEENPLRCPVKLYEFYLSKCPESVKTRNDVFYLQPERSCVPDSPVWYSTQPLSRDALSKMLHRVKMVKEINIALLTS